jgi:hypothetical protein
MTGLAGRSSANQNQVKAISSPGGRGLKVRANVNSHSTEKVEKASFSGQTVSSNAESKT